MFSKKTVSFESALEEWEREVCAKELGGLLAAVTLNFRDFFPQFFWLWRRSNNNEDKWNRTTQENNTFFFNSSVVGKTRL